MNVLFQRWHKLILIVCANLVISQTGYAISIDAENGAGPWGNQEGQGCGNDLVKAAYQASNVPIELEIVPYSRCKQDVLRGHVVACFGMGEGDEQTDKYVTFAKPALYMYRSSFITRSEKTDIPKNIMGIPSGAKVGIVHGYEYAKEILELEKKGIHFVKVNFESQLVKMVASERIDFAIINADTLKTEAVIIRSALGTNSFRVRTAFKGPSLGTYLGFSNVHPDSQIARKGFEDGMKKLTKTGELKKIMKNCNKYLK